MGDRYIMTVECPYCGFVKQEFWYAPTCGVDSHECEECHKTSFISNFKLVKAEEVTAEELSNEFINNLNIWHPSDEDIKDILKGSQDRIDAVLSMNGDQRGHNK